MKILTDGDQIVVVIIRDHVRMYQWGFQGFDLIFDNRRPGK